MKDGLEKYGLKDFRHDHSAYDRPNQPWVCGWAEEGRPCRVGPDGKGQCRADFTCQPLKRGDRWTCARPANAGGPCADGPSPAGVCACPIPKCQPVRGMRARRGALTVAITTLMIGLVTFGLSGPWRNRFVSPGDLVAKHGALFTQSTASPDAADSELEGACAQCHPVAGRVGPSRWVGLAFDDGRGERQSKACLRCHTMGLTPHNLEPAKLAESTTRIKESASVGAPPIGLRLASIVGGSPMDHTEMMTCAICHKEHQGKDHDLKALSNEQCQICHAKQFKSFADGHPPFARRTNEGNVIYPYKRRARVAFDHASHMREHFPQKKQAFDCVSCHVTDPSGRIMSLHGFERTCAECHAGDIRQGSGDRGVAFLRLPGVDAATLRAKGFNAPAWPEFAEGDLTPFMKLMIAADANYSAEAAFAADLEIWDKLDRTDLSGAEEPQVAAAGRVVEAIRRLVDDLTAEGQPALRARIEKAAARPITDDEFQGLAGGLPVEALRAARAAWLVATPTPQPTPEAKPPANKTAKDDEPKTGRKGEKEAAKPKAESDDILGGDDDILGGDDNKAQDDILGGEEKSQDDILGGDDTQSQDDILGGDDTAAPDPPEETEKGSGSELVEDEDKIVVGGWYRQDTDYTIRYRPEGHGDAFLRRWLELSAKASSAAGAGESAGGPGEQALRGIFASLASTQAPGQCVKCHSVDAAPAGNLINWKSRQAMRYEREFTKFRHEPHLTLVKDSRGCVTCHIVNESARFMDGFRNAEGAPLTDLMRFESNFMPMNQRTCAECHTPKRAGDSCLMCHNYHIGTISPAMVRLDEEESPPPVEGGENLAAVD